MLETFTLVADIAIVLVLLVALAIRRARAAEGDRQWYELAEREAELHAWQHNMLACMKRRRDRDGSPMLVSAHVPRRIDR